MSDTGPFSPGTTMPYFASPNLPAVAFSGVRSRRMVAFCLDFVLVSIVVAILWTVLFVVTLGLSALLLPPLFPFVAFFYNGVTVSGLRMGTPGMRAMDLEIRAVDRSRVTFIAAAIHAVLLYVSWMFPPVFLVSLLTSDKRCLHDIVAGVIVVRRPI
jgi:uncharacterized RDD family membrane protein YckC